MQLEETAVDASDQLFVSVFSDPEHAAGLLRDLLPPPLGEAIDWESLRPLPPPSGPPALLFEALAAGLPLLLYVRLAAGDVRRMPLQLMAAAVEAWQQHGRGGALPPLVPVVVNQGPEPRQVPRDLLGQVDLRGLPPAVARILAPLQPNLHFVLDEFPTWNTLRDPEKAADGADGGGDG